jgi:hypothetical protein
MGEPIDSGTFPFGRPVLPRPPSASTKRCVFILGAYPSALHVSWRAPTGEPIHALAVDNEPLPFWSGDGEDAYITRWKALVGFRDGDWGRIAGVGRSNGSSGRWVDDKVLIPLKARRDDAWITDCLDTYFSSERGAAAVAERYSPFAVRAGLPAASLAVHPTESTIAKLGVREHRDRLLHELSDAAPDIVVTLGNAALKVLRTIMGATDAPTKLRADSGYGTERTLSVDGRDIVWFPLAHPAAPRAYQDAHARWCRKRGELV